MQTTTIYRSIEDKIKKSLFKGKIIIIYGPRQAGKTTLSKRIIAEYNKDGGYFDCQDIYVKNKMLAGDAESIKSLIGDKKVVVFDEAQTIENIGLVFKVYFDKYKDDGVQIIATGSSSFDLSDKVKEPLTGRSIEFMLFPLSFREISNVKNIDFVLFKDLMLYGSYPAVFFAKTKEDKEMEIANIANNYLYKDIFILDSIKNSRAFESILKLLSGQIGQIVNSNEIAREIGINRATVDKYIRLLEHAFIIKVIYPFSNNLRNERKKGFKVYFLDLGIRNYLYDIKSDFEKRSDKGNIFENFVINDKLKEFCMQTIPPELMFWRNNKGLEIDIIEKDGINLVASECKLKDKDVSFRQFLNRYPEAKTKVITLESYLAP